MGKGSKKPLFFQNDSKMPTFLKSLIIGHSAHDLGIMSQEIIRQRGNFKETKGTKGQREKKRGREQSKKTRRQEETARQRDKEKKTRMEEG
jgi:hypothetical protein